MCSEDVHVFELKIIVFKGTNQVKDSHLHRPCESTEVLKEEPRTQDANESATNPVLAESQLCVCFCPQSFKRAFVHL